MLGITDPEAVTLTTWNHIHVYIVVQCAWFYKSRNVT